MTMTVAKNAIAVDEDFRQQLEDARKPAHSGPHPFSQAWAEGKLTKEQLIGWCKQHYYYIETVGQMFGMMYVRTPDVDARLFILDNLMGEELMGDRHPDLLLRFAESLGTTRQEVMEADLNGEILPSTRAMRSWTLELANFRPLYEAAAGIMIGLEGQLPTIYPKYVKALKETLGSSDDDLKFFYVHIEGDEGHEDNGVQIVARYATTPEQRRAAIATVRASAEVRYAYLNGIYRHYILNEGRL